MKDGEEKGSSLTGAGLRFADDIFTGHGGGDKSGLDGAGGLVADFVNDSQQGGTKIQVSKTSDFSRRGGILGHNIHGWNNLDSVRELRLVRKLIDTVT
jgi:hypothetical protein